jgi:hypothetical protein
MEELFSKPWWESIGVLTGGLLSVIAIIIAIRQNKKKRLVYSVPYLIPLVDINEKIKNDFEIKYKGEVISQVCLTEIKIENTGSIPVKKEDFDEPIKIEIQNCKHIFSLELIDVFPENLSVNLDVISNSNIIHLNPLLLNPKDFIKFKIVFEGDDSSIKITSRIADLSQIQLKKESINSKMWLVFILISIVTGILINILSDNFGRNEFESKGAYQFIKAILLELGTSVFILIPLFYLFEKQIQKISTK